MLVSKLLKKQKIQTNWIMKWINKERERERAFCTRFEYVSKLQWVGTIHKNIRLRTAKEKRINCILRAKRTVCEMSEGKGMKIWSVCFKAIVAIGINSLHKQSPQMQTPAKKKVTTMTEIVAPNKPRISRKKYGLNCVCVQFATKYLLLLFSLLQSPYRHAYV